MLFGEVYGRQRGHDDSCRLTLPAVVFSPSSERATAFCCYRCCYPPRNVPLDEPPRTPQALDVVNKVRRPRNGLSRAKFTQRGAGTPRCCVEAIHQGCRWADNCKSPSRHWWRGVKVGYVRNLRSISVYLYTSSWRVFVAIIRLASYILSQLVGFLGHPMSN